MMKFNLPFLLFAILGLWSLPSFAYMGPGAGLTAFACLMALLAGIWYVLKGFFWLPLKRRFAQKSANKTEQQDVADVRSDKDTQSKEMSEQHTDTVDKTS